MRQRCRICQTPNSGVYGHIGVRFTVRDIALAARQDPPDDRTVHRDTSPSPRLCSARYSILEDPVWVGIDDTGLDVPMSCTETAEACLQTDDSAARLQDARAACGAASVFCQAFTLGDNRAAKAPRPSPGSRSCTRYAVEERAQDMSPDARLRPGCRSPGCAPGRCHTRQRGDGPRIGVPILPTSFAQCSTVRAASAVDEATPTWSPRLAKPAGPERHPCPRVRCPRH